MRGHENLIPGVHKLTREENRRGGVNSGVARRQKRSASEVAKMILEGSLRGEDIVEGIEVDDNSVICGIVAMLARKGLDGNVKATELLLTLAGEYEPRASVKANVVRDDESLRELDEYFARKRAEYQADSMTE